MMMTRATEWIHSLRLRTESIPDQFNTWLAKLPTVQYQVLISSFMAMGTALVFWYCMAAGQAIDSLNFATWLGFIAAMGHIAYKGFAKKRETYNPTLPTDQRPTKAPEANKG